MHITKHMAVRMAQRNFTPAMVDAILDTGGWNDRGDQLVLDQRQAPELSQIIMEKRRRSKELTKEGKQLEKEARELERLLRRKGRATVVTAEGELITTYLNTRKKH